MAELCNEIHAVVGDKVGKLAEVAAKLNDLGINISALCAWVDRGIGHLRMVTDDNEKTCGALSDIVENCRRSVVVGVTAANRIGSLGEIAGKIAAEGIAIKSAYATAAGEQALIVLDTSDNEKAASLV